MKFLLLLTLSFFAMPAVADMVLIPADVGVILDTDTATAVVTGKAPYYPATHVITDKTCSGVSGTLYGRTAIISFPGQSSRDKQVSIYTSNAAIGPSYVLEYLETVGTCSQLLSSGETVQFNVTAVSEYPKGKRTEKFSGGGWTRTATTGTPGTGTCTYSRGGQSFTLTSCDWQ